MTGQAFEKEIFRASLRQPAESEASIFMAKGLIVLYRTQDEATFFVVGSDDENEVILVSCHRRAAAAPSCSVVCLCGKSRRRSRAWQKLAGCARTHEHHTHAHTHTRTHIHTHKHARVLHGDKMRALGICSLDSLMHVHHERKCGRWESVVRC